MVRAGPEQRSGPRDRRAGLLPADFPFPQLPLAAALRRLGDGLGTPPPGNGALLARATAVSGPGETTPVVPPLRWCSTSPPAELANAA
ncbi:hypothetical protein [Streptomyces sp. NPDC058457]|uniref:hypothetical protein n=1 Tax=Streptomyces sp. NPDC058457 TaxID=3346507 RepID=UPI003653B5A3